VSLLGPEPTNLLARRRRGHGQPRLEVRQPILEPDGDLHKSSNITDLSAMHVSHLHPDMTIRL